MICIGPPLFFHKSDLFTGFCAKLRAWRQFDWSTDQSGWCCVEATDWSTDVNVRWSWRNEHSCRGSVTLSGGSNNKTVWHCLQVAFPFSFEMDLMGFSCGTLRSYQDDVLQVRGIPSACNPSLHVWGIRHNCLSQGHGSGEVSSTATTIWYLRARNFSFDVLVYT